MEKTVEIENLNISLEEMTEAEQPEFIIRVDDDCTPLLTVNLKATVEAYLENRYDEDDNLTVDEIQEDVIPEFEDLLTILDELKGMVQEKIDEAQEFVDENSEE